MVRVLWRSHLVWLVLAALLMENSCSKVSGPMAIFKKLSPHDQYAQRLKDAGLDRSAMGTKWLQSADGAFTNVLNVTLSYKEVGYFDAVKVPASAVRFDVKRGQKIRVTLTHKPVKGFMIFADLWKENAGTNPKLLSSADTTTGILEQSVSETGKYILRLQPELLKSGEYTLTITSQPSLGFPVSAVGKPHIESFWGADRDAGERRHEGIDIFAPKGTPAIAAANGTITNVGENKLGGLVVFMRPDDADYNLYYAHLSKQIAQTGQAVKLGDTLGLVGNTGNAAGGPTHLHFGIYTGSGAIDPLAFVDREVKQPKPVTASLDLLNGTLQVKSKTTKLHVEPNDKALSIATFPQNSVLTAVAATDGWYKIITPDGYTGFTPAANLRAGNTLRSTTAKNAITVLDAPDTAAARKKTISVADKMDVLGFYKGYQLVKSGDVVGWVEMR
ncbi:peptidoglycan DD-metalloendopeptidase family protein [Mucilaginibacter ginkgonis]|uniref:M23 family metallopeptidase n=1 Tax=Mucilaginibacter ginkgonis TaxID=2682091 RepID=A0A6I4I5G2_9SPHI|nr:peptidoglycan DD-metalloendopeptidase family protein [Mucilaginibacter ginkgonis]QQL48416.1 M23 family metallopeptidase [Mucilaginibacter ginkgonis]